MAWIWQLLGGVVLFLFGMALMGEHIHQLAGGRLERTLRRVTAGRYRGALAGFLTTAVVQSSSAVTVLAVSLTDGGILPLRQTIPVVIGSNVGTTATAWLLCLRTGAYSDTTQIFTAAMACAGLLLYLAVPKRRAWGGVLLGLFLLLLGMEQMADAATPLAGTDAFQELTALGEHPLLAVAAGTAVTGLLQSSSASIGLLQALCATEAITWEMGVPLVLGGNIGTCVTVLMASIGGGPNAKRAALAHLQFNLLGTTAAIPLWLAFGVPLRELPISPMEIAAVHTGFNLFSAALLLPLSDRLTGFFFAPSLKRRKTGQI